MKLRSGGFLLITLSVCSLTSTIGCSKTEIAKVTGTVSRNDGTPVVGARVIARSGSTGKSASGQTDANGFYELGVANSGDGIAPGDYYVVIIEDLGDENNRHPPTIASKYGKPATSGLKFSVQVGEKKVFDMKLDSK